MMDDIKNKLHPSKRTRSLSAERPRSRSGAAGHTAEDKSNYNSLGRTITGKFSPKVFEERQVWLLKHKSF